MALNANALIDVTYFNQMWQDESLDPDYIENCINAVSSSFEKFCNRNLKQRSYTYVSDDEDAEANIYYVPEYCIFDAPPKNIFWFPTYPVSEVSYFEVSGIEVALSTNNSYMADDGYLLYNRSGKLFYSYGFDYPYSQNVRVKWIGGYADNSMEMSHLKYLCFMTLKDFVNAPQNMTYQSETIGQYSYKTIATTLLTQLQGLSPNVFADLSKYRREVIG
jgi:hypothetical protein